MADRPKSSERLTTVTGAPITVQQALTAGPRGPVLMEDVQLLEQMQHFNRERIPERVVHAKGSGAYGTFTVTSDLTRYTKAKFLSHVRKQTDVLARFSTVAGERASTRSASSSRLTCGQASQKRSATAVPPSSTSSPIRTPCRSRRTSPSPR